MKTFVILLHGFNVWDGGRKSIQTLTQYFKVRGCDVDTLSYGWFGLLKARYCNEEVASELAARIDGLEHQGYERIIVVGHSNGCAIAHLASRMFEHPRVKYVYLNPALRREAEPHPRVKEVDVWYNGGDWAVALSKLLFWKAIERPWGIMGRVGYTGYNPAIRNFDTGTIKPHALGHSGIFKRKNRYFYGHLIATKALEFHNG